MRARVFTFGLAIVIGLFGGYIFRAIFKGDAPSVAAVAEGESRKITGGSELDRRGSVAAVGFRNQGQEKADLSKSAGVMRWLHWVASLENAGVDDMERLAKFTKGNAGAREMLVARWMELDPRHLFDVASSSPEGSLLYELEWEFMTRWIKEDMNAAVEALRGSDAPGIGRWRMNVVGDVIEVDAELGLTLFHEWHIGAYVPHLDAVEKWARADPRYAAEFVLARPAASLTEAASELIGKIWAESDPAAALAFCEQSSSRYGHSMADKVLKSWAKADFSAAADWLGQANPATHSRMADAFVAVWAESDPHAALDWSQENLSGHVLENAVAATVRQLVTKDRGAAAQLVDGMEVSREKAAAAAAVGVAWMPDFRENTPVSPEAKEWIEGLDAKSRERVLAATLWRWMRSDRKGLAEFLTRPKAAIASDQVVSRTAHALVRHDPGWAINWAQKLPEAHRKTTMESVYSSWSQSQPQAAHAWLMADPGRKALVIPE